jgi:16S rRNA U516 pseudouridylate synthase RsuA-like enzyme
MELHLAVIVASHVGSLTYARSLIENGMVSVNGEVVIDAQKKYGGAEIKLSLSITLPEPIRYIRFDCPISEEAQ